MEILPMDDKVRRCHEEARRTDAYWIEALQIDLTFSLLDAMERADVSRADLARRLGCSRPYVTKMLKGDVNFTVETLVKLARALGCSVEVPRMVPGEEPVTVSNRVRLVDLPAAAPYGWSVPDAGRWTADVIDFVEGPVEIREKPAAA